MRALLCDAYSSVSFFFSLYFLSTQHTPEPLSTISTMTKSTIYSLPSIGKPLVSLLHSIYTPSSIHHHPSQQSFSNRVFKNVFPCVSLDIICNSSLLLSLYHQNYLNQKTPSLQLHISYE